MWTAIPSCFEQPFNLFVFTTHPICAFLFHFCENVCVTFSFVSPVGHLLVIIRALYYGLVEFSTRKTPVFTCIRMIFFIMFFKLCNDTLVLILVFSLFALSTSCLVTTSIEYIFECVYRRGSLLFQSCQMLQTRGATVFFSFFSSCPFIVPT